MKATLEAIRMTITLALLVWTTVSWSAEPSPLGVRHHGLLLLPRTGQVVMTLIFSRVPDLTSVDAFGRQADAFQVWLTYEGGPASGDSADSLIRGAEIYVADTVRLRWIAPASSDPNAGGWGELIGEVPYFQRGRLLSFAFPFAWLQATSPEIAYELETYYDYGHWDGRTYTGVSVGPRVRVAQW
jgi:hypothetical protein